MPDIGAMIAFVEASTGRKPDRIIGKPYPPIVEAVSKKRVSRPSDSSWTATGSILTSR